MEDSYRQLESFYLEHRQQLFTCALAVTRCPERAEDAIQDVFHRMFRLPRLPGNLKSYIFRSVRNAAVDTLRKRHNTYQDLNPSIFDPGPGPHQIAAKEELVQRAEEALQLLTDDERETVVHHLYGDLTFREIAEMRTVPIGTVTSWYRRGIQKLRERLEDCHE